MPVITASQHEGIIQRSESSLHSPSIQSNHDDITLFTNSQLGTILTRQEILQFVAQADGLFIWAFTAAEFIKKARHPSKLFRDLMESTLPERPLDSLYTTILSSASERVGKNEQPLFVNVLQLICVAQEPLNVEAMDELLELKVPSGSSVSGSFVAGLSSVLSDGGDGGAIQALHPTFIEFLLRWRQLDQLVISIQDAESLLARGCLAILLSDKLKHDILDIAQPKTFARMNKDIERLKQQIQEKTTPGLRYAAVHSMSHMAASLHDGAVIRQLRQFYESKLLFWIELMSYLGKIYVLMQSIHSLASCMQDVMKTNDYLLVSTVILRGNIITIWREREVPHFYFMTLQRLTHFSPCLHIP